MDRKAVYLLMIVVVLAEAAFLWLLVFRSFYFFYLGLIAFYAPAIAFMVVCFLPKIRMGVAPGTPEQVFSTMSLNFRIAQYRVTDKGRSFVVQGGNDHGIRIYTKAIGSDSIVLIKSDPTPAGWGALMILLIFTYGFGTIPYSLYLFMKSQKFGLSVIPTMYRHPGETIVLERPSKTRVCLIDTLSEGYRLSSEAYESAKSNYEDLIVIGAVVGIVAAITVYVLAVLAMGGDFASRTENMIAAGFGLATGIGVPVIAYVRLRRKSRQELLSLRGWAEKLREELAQEVISAAPRDRQTSTFEVVLDAYKELPGWLRIRRKSGLHRSPVLWMAVLFLAMYGSTYLLTASISSWQDLSSRVILGAVSTAFIVLSIGLYFYWRRKETAEARKVSETWQRRSDAIQRKMDEMIKDL